MTAAKEAKHLGVESLTALTSTTGYNLDTLRRMHKGKPFRFRLLCLGHVCEKLGVEGQELKHYKKLQQEIGGKKS